MELLRTSDSVKVSEDGKQVRRAKPIESPEEVAKKVDARSLYAAPFPFDTTLDAVTAFFNTVAPVNCVRMRRHIVSKDFRGSVFVEFASEEQAAEVRAVFIWQCVISSIILFKFAACFVRKRTPMHVACTKTYI